MSVTGALRPRVRRDALGGDAPREARGVVLLETLFLTLLASRSGGMAGYGVNLYFAAHPICSRRVRAVLRRVRGSFRRSWATSSPAVPLIVAGVMFLPGVPRGALPGLPGRQARAPEGIRYT